MNIAATHLVSHRCFVPAVALLLYSASPLAAQYTLETLVSFDVTHGGYPYSDLAIGADGRLYGTTSYVGEFGYGTVFRLDPATGNLDTLASFNQANGAYPLAGLIFGADGHLYGTTFAGGAFGRGTVFRLDASTGELDVLKSFNGANGDLPSAGLVFDTSGNLYGTTVFGGTFGSGTVFRLDTVTGDLDVLVSIKSSAGSYAGLVFDAGGHLYGTTGHGGDFGLGTVFRLDPATGELDTLASFNGANGDLPLAGLIFDVDGHLYGTTSHGGAFGYGTVFRLDPATGELDTLVSFNDAAGAYPRGGLIFDASDNLYGTTSRGGAIGYGTVFRLDAATGELDVLASFNYGASPTAGLVFDASGNLFGTTELGGAFWYGTVFRLSPIVPEPSALPLVALAAAGALLLLGRFGLPTAASQAHRIGASPTTVSRRCP